jgi:hypothetical protein
LAAGFLAAALAVLVFATTFFGEAFLVWALPAGLWAPRFAAGLATDLVLAVPFDVILIVLYFNSAHAP